MRNKRIASIVVAILGAAMIIYAIYGMSRIANAKGEVSSINKTISNTSVGKMVGSELSSKASQYDNEVRGLLIAGIVLVVAGCGGAYYFRKRR